MNPFPRDVWLKPRASLGTAHGAVKVTIEDKVEFDARTNELIVFRPPTTESQTPSLKEPWNWDPQRENDLSADFPGTAAENQETFPVV